MEKLQNLLVKPNRGTLTQDISFLKTIYLLQLAAPKWVEEKGEQVHGR